MDDNDDIHMPYAQIQIYAKKVEETKSENYFINNIV